jgi:crotonobetainyl-CoA:carnitine CoA-transferase CaiB-like acyl-CoA transferase
MAAAAASTGRPLDGLTVLDLTHMLSGPYGAMMLADLGARTIKVEPPGQGEQTRRLGEDDADHTVDGVGTYFLTLNRNKLSVALNLKSPDGRRVFLDLVAQADVVLDNFAVGVMKRLGLDHEALAAVNSRIVTCSITGFGEYGPDIERPAFDQVVQAMSGGMSITGDDASGPMRSGIPIGDLGGGLFAATGILAALHERVRTGCGQHVDVSMLDCQISLLSYIGAMYLKSGIVPHGTGNGHAMHVPYNAYPTADGHLVVACIGDGFFRRLADCLGDPALAAQAYRTQQGRRDHKEAIETVVRTHLASQTNAYWLARFGAAKIPCAPVNDLAQAFADPQVRARNMVVPLRLDSGRSIEVPGTPIKFSRSAQERFAPPPAVGRDTESVLRQVLRYDDAEIDRLIATADVG